MTAAPTTDRTGTARPDRSPFDSPLVLWLLVAAGLYGLFPWASFTDVVRHLDLPDTDDAMRLVQVRDLLAGQGWFDMTQHRLTPPEGASMHWSRFVDVPLAGLIGALAPLLGRPLAEGLTVALWPPLLFGLYLALAYRALAPRFGRRAAMLGLFAATQTGELGGLFAFGRIDHHNIQILLILGLGLMLADPSPRRAAAAGLLAAASLAVGLEALPFIGIAALLLLGDWILAGGRAGTVLAAFGFCLAGGATLLFAAQTAPGLWLTSRCDALSPPWLWIAGAGALIGVGALFLAAVLATPMHRAAFAGSLGSLSLLAFAWLFRPCLSGPFTGMPPVVRREWLEGVMEMQPFPVLLATKPAEAMAYVAPLLIGALIAGWAAAKGAPAIRRGAALTAAFLAAGFVLAQFQFRGIYVAAGFLPLVAGPMLDRAIALLREEAPAWRRAATLAGAVLLLAKVWAVPFALARSAGGTAASGSSTAETWQSCTSAAALAPLNDPGLGTGTILAAINDGPPILVHTGHAVVAAPYHRALAGLAASIEGLGGDEAALERAMRDSNATYLVLCSAAPPGGSPTPFAARLMGEDTSVPWLERVPLVSTPIALWRRRSGN